MKRSLIRKYTDVRRWLKIDISSLPEIDCKGSSYVSDFNVILFMRTIAFKDTILLSMLTLLLCLSCLPWKLRIWPNRSGHTIPSRKIHLDLLEMVTPPVQIISRSR